MNFDELYFFGRYFKIFGGYNSGGVGYVFSWEIVCRFKKVLGDIFICLIISFVEDVEVGKCFNVVGVKFD